MAEAPEGYRGIVESVRKSGANFDRTRVKCIYDLSGIPESWGFTTGVKKLSFPRFENSRNVEVSRQSHSRAPKDKESDAKKVLIAAAVTDDSISFVELESILEFSEDRLLSALTELQSLFLFPRAPVVEGEQRYQINLNTKKLVRLVEGQSDLYARVDSVSKALAGKLPDVGRGTISSLIRQAHLRLNANQNSEAETILLNAIERYPNAADLRDFLGYVYRRTGRL